ncbi:MAG TPA: gliding motility lipoprotein GldD, partial [Chryseolinea sp.]|nr:gliding motility lipoprotein GldD [Chryseolinea sp.]
MYIQRRLFFSLVLLASLAGILAACQQDYTPKPLGYNRLNLPDPSYRVLPDSLPYTFEYSDHAKLLDDTSAISERFWIEIYYPEIKANVHITYKPIRNEKMLKEF